MRDNSAVFKRVITAVKLYLPVIIPVCVLLGWLLISRLEDYYLSTLYPLYFVVVFAGAGMVKYRKVEIGNLQPRERRLELILYGTIAAVLALIAGIATYIGILIPAFAILLALIVLFLITYCIVLYKQ